MASRFGRDRGHAATFWRGEVEDVVRWCMICHEAGDAPSTVTDYVYDDRDITAESSEVCVVCGLTLWARFIESEGGE
jgi:hypothetical protein